MNLERRQADRIEVEATKRDVIVRDSRIIRSVDFDITTPNRLCTAEAPGGATRLLPGLGSELLTQGEFYDRLPASASKEDRNTAKEDRRELEPMPHSETSPERDRCSVRD